MKYYVFECNLEGLTKKLESITRKAKKQNIDFSFSVNVNDFQMVEIDRAHYKKVAVEISDKMYRVGQWQFVALIEHTPVGNIIQSYQTLPESYKNASGICEHCNSNRARKYTCVVQNENGEYKQVGKSCLKEYTGIDVNWIIQVATMLEMMDDASDPALIEGSYSPKYYDVEFLISCSVACIEKYGYHKTDSEMPTKRFAKEEYRQHDYITEEQKAIAKNVMQWLLDADANSDYMCNLQVIAKGKYCTERHIGYIVSAYNAYKKAMAQQAQKPESKAVDYIGTVGEKVNFEIESFEFIAQYDTMYGTNFIYKINDAFVWHTAKDIDNANGKMLKGTIKAHNEYRGEKQTVLTRCTIK